jgi:hypothetical protein
MLANYSPYVMKQLFIITLLFCTVYLQSTIAFAQTLPDTNVASSTDTINYFLTKYPQYKNTQIDKEDLLAVAALYKTIDEADTAWADIAIKVRNRKIVDISITGLNKTTLPESLKRLNALEGLAIKGCYLYALPDLSPFPFLKNLAIWTSRMKDTLVVGESYKNLEILGLHHLHAKSIQFAKNLKLKTLFVIDCDIAILHESFLNLKEVEEIHLGGNKLQDFNLTELPKLKKINCYKNFIATIHRKTLKNRHKNIEINFDAY